MTTPIESFNRKECELIDALKVNAYIDLYLDPENPTGIILDTSWGEVKVDLLSIVKAGETVTHLELYPADTPTALKYTNEAGDVECITGDELSRIISMTLLKDVDQSQTIQGGNVYMYNETTHMFEPFDLQTFVDNTNHALTIIDAALTQLGNRITDIENLIYNYPADKTTKIPRGNINVYGDINNNNNHDWGIFSHDKNSNITNDLYFS